MSRRLGGLNAQGDPNLEEIYTNNLPEVHDVIRRMRDDGRTSIPATAC